MQSPKSESSNSKKSKCSSRILHYNEDHEIESTNLKGERLSMTVLKANG